MFEFRFRFLFGEFLFFDEFFGDADDGTGREIAEAGMSDHSVNGCGVPPDRASFGKVETGDLETVKEQASAFRMHAAARDALQDFCDSGEYTAAVFQPGKLKVILAIEGASFRSLTRGVVIIAKLFVAQRRAAAPATTEEDVTALIALAGLFGRLDDLVWHGGTPPILKS